MKIQDRYITKTLLTFTFTVLLIWVGIYGFFDFLSELNQVGIENYTFLKNIESSFNS